MNWESCDDSREKGESLHGKRGEEEEGVKSEGQSIEYVNMFVCGWMWREETRGYVYQIT